MEKKTLILGVGNLLLKDEGSVYVIRALEKETLPAHVTPDGWRDGRICILSAGSLVTTISSW